MNTYNINDQEFVNSTTYQNFLDENPGRGRLRIRANSASEAVPVSGVEIVVSKIIDNNNVIFFEGVTNESGVIERISLPAPLTDPNNLDVPNTTSYDVKATYTPNNFSLLTSVNMYDDVCVIQIINIAPDMNIRAGGSNGR